DIGERLWGRNEIVLRTDGPPRQPLRPALMVKDAAGTVSARLDETVDSLPPAAHDFKVPYRLESLCADWRKQCRVEGTIPFAFGTPPSPVTVRLDSVYPYPDERLGIGVILNVAMRSLGE